MQLKITVLSGKKRFGILININICHRIKKPILDKISLFGIRGFIMNEKFKFNYYSDILNM